jgi:2,5-furandicarboxylate decarboxylase 1
MQENFRQFLDRLRQTGELVDLHQPVDIRHISTLVDQAETALFFHNVIGYDMPVVSGIIRSRERATMALGCDAYAEIEHKLKAAIDKPIPPTYVKSSPTREVTLVDDEVDLYRLPIPMSSIYDGGPMITAGVVIARDPELGVNSGIYRFIVKEKSLTGIDIVTPNNMRLFAQRALERKEALPISISIGTHPIEITGSGYRAPLGVDEMGIAGGLRGAPVELAPCQTIDVPYIADAEIVLEAEILPTGWTWPEGRFGEFTRLMAGCTGIPWSASRRSRCAGTPSTTAFTCRGRIPGSRRQSAIRRSGRRSKPRACRSKTSTSRLAAAHSGTP